MPGISHAVAAVGAVSEGIENEIRQTFVGRGYNETTAAYLTGGSIAIGGIIIGAASGTIAAGFAKFVPGGGIIITCTSASNAQSPHAKPRAARPLVMDVANS